MANYKPSDEDSHQNHASLEQKINRLSDMVRDMSERREPESFGVDQRANPDSIDPFLTTRNLYYTNADNQDMLTNRVWPKTRMLLAIVSRMYKEKVVNLDQRGKLKDLIIDSDPRLNAPLNDYYLDGNRNNLYRNLISLT